MGPPECYGARGYTIKTADPHACIDMGAFPANSVHSPNVGLMLGQRH